MSASSIMTVVRGEDINFITKLRAENGDPYDLTGWTTITVQFKKNDGNFVSVDTTPIPAESAYAEHEGVTYTADVAGSAGNAISLVFDGIETIEQVVLAWNTANPTNTVSHDAVDDQVVPTATTLQFDQGVDQYSKVEVQGSPLLGKLLIKATSEDTEQFRTGSRVPISVLVDKGNPPAGLRKIARIKEAMNVLDRSI